MRCVGIMFVVLSVLACGCTSNRYSAYATVDDVGANVYTKYRYKTSCAFKGDSSEQLWFDGSFLPKCQPGVFSADGLPIVLRIEYKKLDGSYGWTVLLSMLSCWVIPQLNEYDTTFSCSIELTDEEGCNSNFEIVRKIESALSIIAPTAFLFFNGDAKVDGKRVFSETKQDVSGNMGWCSNAEEEVLRYDVQVRQALSYAMASKLKELEDSGKIDAMLAKKSARKSVAPAHDIISLERDAVKDFSYSFMIEMKGTPANVDAAIAAVLDEFAKSLKEEYLDAVRGSKAAALTVAFSGLKRDGVRISGQAFVLTLKPLSLEYDANSRMGKLSVRFNDGQEEEARTWIHKNVATMARDKNIALVTGEIPPAANFFVLRETVKDGNKLEVEFKTE